MRIAVIGAGIGGLCSIQQIKKSLPDADVVCFEINKDIGGNWIYTDKTGDDEFGLPLTMSMYRSLRTNLPKEIMGFSDYPIPEKYKTFLHNEEYLEFLHSYANHFDLKKHIKFQHFVSLVKFDDNKWEISYENLLTKKGSKDIFDYVFVCNGRYNRPNIPNFKGNDNFKGRQTHSHSYQIPDSYKDENVLVVGSGSSGIQISADVATVAKNVFFSHHKPAGILGPFPSNHHQKPDVKELTENSVLFVDGSSEEINSIIYCTGYKFYAPFLDPSCGITIEKYRISPLYRHLVNIEHPSLFIIGVPQICCSIPTKDMQARYAVALIKNEFQLPSKENMLLHIEDEYIRKDKLIGRGPSGFHDLGPFEPFYNKEMAEESGIVSIPLVFYSIRIATVNSRLNIYTFRNYIYKIVDDEHFITNYVDSSKLSDTQSTV